MMLTTHLRSAVVVLLLMCAVAARADGPLASTTNNAAPAAPGDSGTAGSGNSGIAASGNSGTVGSDESGGGGWHGIHPALGVGATHRSDQWTGKLVPASITWLDDRYEFFVAYFRDQTISGLVYQGYPAHIDLAPPLWAFTLSRRFNFVDRPRFKSFLGLGVAYLDTEPCANPAVQNDHTPVLDFYEPVYHGCDKLNGSRLNYALQLGLRIYNHTWSQGLEFNYRHISNAGMTSGNRGEDFLTALLVF